MTRSTGPDSFHVMAKPAGPLCNLDCTYCFYLDKESLFKGTGRMRMSDEVLETYVRQIIDQQGGNEVLFAWQGGEPTLMGIEFYEKAVALQKRYAQGRVVQNAFQTNGVLIDDRWAEFFARERFLIGLSLDGPQELHDLYRVDKGGKPTFDRVMAGLVRLKQHGVDFNTLTVLHRENARKPKEVYRFLKEVGSGYLQFIPLVERMPSSASVAQGLTHAPPPQPAGDEKTVTEWSVTAEDYGNFLVTMFDEWVRSDVGKVYVQLFDVSLGIWMGHPSGLCLFSETCGTAVALEHNGDVFSCDHFVYPRYRLGNIMNESLGALVSSPAAIAFGQAKLNTLPRYCRECEVRFACHGECPKNRFITTPDGEPGLNYLCAAFKQFFHHINPAMRTMAALAFQGKPPAKIMESFGNPQDSK